MISEDIKKEVLFACDPEGQELYSKLFTLLTSLTEFQQFKEFKSTKSNKYEAYEEFCNEIAVLITNQGIDTYVLCNKIKGIRAALVQNEYASEKTKEHNDANLIIVPSYYIGWEVAQNIIMAYCKQELVDPFHSHSRRIELIAKIENGEIQSK